MTSLDVFFLEHAQVLTHPLILFFRNHSPQLIGYFIFFLAALSAKRLYIDFHIDKIARNAYNEEKEGTTK